MNVANDKAAHALGVPDSIVRRQELSTVDGASIDQLQAGLGEAFGLMPLSDTSAAQGALVALRAVEQRMVAMVLAGRSSDDSAHAVVSCCEEIRMALVGLLD
jgi:hypothetical protein